MLEIIAQKAYYQQEFEKYKYDNKENLAGNQIDN